MGRFPSAGFSDPNAKDLWLRIAENYKEFNVAAQLKDPDSFLNFFRKLLAFRESSPALKWGSYRSLDVQPAEAQKDVFVFEREADGQRVVVALNFSGRDQKLEIQGMERGKIVLSTGLDRDDEVDLSEFELRANEGCIVEI